MKKSLLAIAVALASPFVPSQTRAQNYLPMEVVVGRADRIVVGEVTAIGKPTEMELDIPDFPTPHKGWYHTFTVKVTRQILPVPTTVLPLSTIQSPPQPQVIEVLTMCADPNPKPAGRVLEGPPVNPLKSDITLKAVNAQQAAYHSALVGDSYLMILDKLPGRGEYYLPSYSMNFRPYTDAGVKEVGKLAAAGIDSWSWGKAVNGLQVGLYLFDHHNIGGGPNSFMEASIVLRNTTDKPLAVNLYDVDRFLEITATASDGRFFRSEFYNWKKHPVTQFDAAVNTIVIAPKGKAFIDSTGRANTIKWAMPLNPGKYDFQASYTSKREGNGKDRLKKLWIGTVNSKPFTCTIYGKPGM
jgi:hypothetical protein